MEVCELNHFDDENEIKNNGEGYDLEGNYGNENLEKNYSDSNSIDVEKIEETDNKYELKDELERLQISFNKKGRKRFISGTLAGVILGSAVTLGATYAFLPNMLSMRGISLDGAQQEITINPTQDLTVYSAVAKKVMPSVVGITTVALERDWFYGVREVSGVGTGVIVDKRGYILTNSHVVGDGNVKEVMVLLHDGRQIKAEVLWNEKSLDLAIIKVEGENLTVAELGDSDETEVGEIAIAIGNPLGLTFERTLTQGVISGLNRTITVNAAGETIENLMQTDASINPGNSGGPLLNARGQVIGINTAKISTGEGLGFAIPINIAKPIVDQFIEKGEFTRVYLGIQGVDIDVYEGATGQKAQSDEGVYVAQTIENSIATKYGIKPSDIIVKIGNDKVSRMSNLVRSLYKYRPGDKTTVTVIRNNQEVNIDVVFE
ncbi:trypsin-like peptidase domain-containing protein [Alkaliphilus sp. MSJ-5]|uniref:Trypsin-like peptidase domain-containing protein n=1 Tax=Alkaliphilus flagellatus TaxID=2841507 RepID=A0ABS6G3T7_9FIRM|nr:trypsin-like peptidase domain-containing protein [Alkaliphilus flagellatus]